MVIPFVPRPGRSSSGGPHHRAVEERRLLAVLAVVALLVVVLYTPVLLDFVPQWFGYYAYNFAVFVPPIALFLLWRRWPALRRQPLEPARRGVLLLGSGLALLVAGVASGVHVVQGLSLIPVLLGLVWFLWGGGAARIVLFPVSYLACGLGLYHGLGSSLGFAMQGITARYASVLANLLGAHNHRDGLLLITPHTQFVVAEQCSGLSSLLALLALGWLVIGEGRGRLPFKVLLCLAIAPLALVANIMRVALVLVLAQDVSTAVAEGFVHGLFSAAIFVFTVSLLLVVRQGMLWLDRSVTAWSPRLS